MKLESLYKIFAKGKDGYWIMEPANANLIYNFIKKHPIKRVLDLGTGIGTSAAVIALALKDKGETDYHIDSVEQFDKCVKLANKLIPEELKEHLTIHKSEAEVWQTPNIPYQYFSTYETLPEGDWDLIVNDGPGPFMVDGHHIDVPNGTITKLLEQGKIKSGAFVAWDGRLHMLKVLERYYSQNFFLYRPAQRGDDLNILERKDNPLTFFDDKLEELRLASYYEEDNISSQLSNTPSETTPTS